MPNIEELSAEAQTGMQKLMRRMLELMEEKDVTPNQRIQAGKLAAEVMKTILAKTHPNLTASHEMHTDVTSVVKQLSGLLSPEETQRLLKDVEVKLLPLTASGRPKEVVHDDGPATPA